MALVEITDCGCDKATNHINLEEIKVLLFCVECGGFHTGFDADIDALIDTLTRLRETRVYGRRAHFADGHTEVIGTRKTA